MRCAIIQRGTPPSVIPCGFRQHPAGGIAVMCDGTVAWDEGSAVALKAAPALLDGLPMDGDSLLDDVSSVLARSSRAVTADLGSELFTSSGSFFVLAVRIRNQQLEYVSLGGMLLTQLRMLHVVNQSPRNRLVDDYVAEGKMAIEETAKFPLKDVIVSGASIDKDGTVSLNRASSDRWDLAADDVIVLPSHGLTSRLEKARGSTWRTLVDCEWAEDALRALPDDNRREYFDTTHSIVTIRIS